MPSVDLDHLIIAPTVRYFWGGAWSGGRIELPRLLYDCELVYVSRGCFDLDLAGNKHRLVKGSLAIIPPATRHQSFVPMDAEVVRHCIHFDWTMEHAGLEAPLFTLLGEPFHVHKVHAVPAAVRRQLPLYVQLEQHGAAIETIELVLRLLQMGDALASGVLAALLRWLVFPPPVPSARVGRTAQARDRVNKVLLHIDDHYMQDLGQEDFCRLSGLSSSHFCKLFHEMTGARPLAYLHMVRIRSAQRMLLEDGAPVSTIAKRVGFEDPNYFSRVFRRTTGKSPVEFRSEARPM